MIPDDHAPFYDEQVVRLPDSYQVNPSRRQASDRAPRREELGLPATGFVFCSFNSNYKSTPSVFDIRMRLLRAVDGGVLWLLEDNAAASSNLEREAMQRDVDPDRLIFAPRSELAEHLARQAAANLFLDTLPCNAHTTASDAL